MLSVAFHQDLLRAFGMQNQKLHVCVLELVVVCSYERKKHVWENQKIGVELKFKIN